MNHERHHSILLPSQEGPVPQAAVYKTIMPNRTWPVNCRILLSSDSTRPGYLQRNIWGGLVVVLMGRVTSIGSREILFHYNM
ncbi:hypothetical protein FKM82_016859 [Ascaphus truei]